MRRSSIDRDGPGAYGQWRQAWRREWADIGRAAVLADPYGFWLDTWSGFWWWLGYEVVQFSRCN